MIFAVFFVLFPLAHAFTGDGTFYSTGMGACGFVSSDGDLIAALNWEQFDPETPNGNPNHNSYCGKKANACYGSNCVEVTIVDRCAGCSFGDLDMSPTAFDKLASAALGRIKISWSWAGSSSTQHPVAPVVPSPQTSIVRVPHPVAPVTSNPQIIPVENVPQRPVTQVPQQGGVPYVNVKNILKSLNQVISRKNAPQTNPNVSETSSSAVASPVATNNVNKDGSNSNQPAPVSTSFSARISSSWFVFFISSIIIFY